MATAAVDVAVAVMAAEGVAATVAVVGAAVTAVAGAARDDVNRVGSGRDKSETGFGRLTRNIAREPFLF